MWDSVTIPKNSVALGIIPKYWYTGVTPKNQPVIFPKNCLGQVRLAGLVIHFNFLPRLFSFIFLMTLHDNDSIVLQQTLVAVVVKLLQVLKCTLSLLYCEKLNLAYLARKVFKQVWETTVLPRGHKINMFPLFGKVGGWSGLADWLLGGC